MTERTKTGIHIILAAGVIGLGGNLLLRPTPWGLNAFLFVAGFVAALLALWRMHWPEMLSRTNVALAGAMVFFASMFLLRDAEELLVFDTLAIIVLMGVLLLAGFGVRAHIGGTFHYIVAVIGAGVNSIFGPFLLLGADIDWRSMPGGAVSRNVFAVLRGVALALPLLLVFGALFMAADAVFEGWVNRAFDFDLDVAVSHAMLTAFLAWLTAGYFRAAAMRTSTTSWGVSTPQTSVVPSGGDASANEHCDRAADTRAGVSSPHGSKGPTEQEASASAPNDATTKAETGPLGSASTPAAQDPTSYVANFTSEQSEPENGLPNNASILEHINISDPPNGTPAPSRPVAETIVESVLENAASADGTKSAPPSKGGVAAASADGVVSSRDWQNIDSSKLPSVFTLGTVETVIVLGLVDLLFAGFVAAQLPYLFGGMELVQNTADLKLADYARRGFGELVFVAALVLPILLASHWLVRRDGSRALGAFRILAGVQIALLFVIMASAVQRLLLLMGDLGYGLTTVRFYPMVFMVWLAVVFAWFAATVLAADARRHFAWGALWSALVILGATNLMNPHAFIASTNLERMQQGRDFDTYYNGRLSDDAAPTLLGSLDRLSPDQARAVLFELERRSCTKRLETDPRTWNLARSRATALFEAHGIHPQTGDSCHDNLDH